VGRSRLTAFRCQRAEPDRPLPGHGGGAENEEKGWEADIAALRLGAAASHVRYVASSADLREARNVELIFEFLFQVVGEVLVQASFELLAEFGFRSLADTVKRPRSPVLSTIGFVLWGAIAGGISLLFFPASPIDDPGLRLANLVITPMLVGVSMTMLGRLREKKGQQLLRLNRFGNAFIFAFSMALVRFAWAK
jgi:hypothetical protein